MLLTLLKLDFKFCIEFSIEKSAQVQEIPCFRLQTELYFFSHGMTWGCILHKKLQSALVVALTEMVFVESAVTMLLFLRFRL